MAKSKTETASFTVDGKKYKLLYNMAAFTWLEEEEYMMMGEILDLYTKWGALNLGAFWKMVKTGLIHEHPDLEQKEVFDLIDSYGIQAMHEKVILALEISGIAKRKN
jgi:hypothetical protein